VKERIFGVESETGSVTFYYIVKKDPYPNPDPDPKLGRKWDPNPDPEKIVRIHNTACSASSFTRFTGLKFAISF
jgi:hypothetical protein